MARRRDRVTSQQGQAGTDVRALGRPLAVYALSRLLVLLGATVAGTDGLLARLANWDGGWYVSVASFGYPDEVVRVGGAALKANIAFFPVYPVLARVLTAVTGLSVEAAAVLVANVAGAVAAVLLWAFVRRLEDEAVADRSVALFCFFPASVILSMVYAEAVMLAAAIGCLFALNERRWVLAGVAGALATATRPNAAVLVLACLWPALTAVVRRSEWRALAAPALTACGVGGYFAWLWARTGEPLAWLAVQQGGWGEQVDLGRMTLARLRASVELGGDAGWALTPSALAFGFAVLAGVLLLRWRPPAALGIYSAGVVGLSVVSRTLGPRPRFVYTAFPLLVAVARVVRGAAFALLLAACATGLVALTVVYTATRLSVP